ncbi:MAG: hypothetical protein H0U58_00520 [Chloroflexi bacterium]|nr:hypothetical protein [Chloroflexota bacterium]
MGGVVVTQAAVRSPERIAALIYVAAFLPVDGQSLLDLNSCPRVRATWSRRTWSSRAIRPWRRCRQTPCARPSTVPATPIARPGAST